MFRSLPFCTSSKVSISSRSALATTSSTACCSRAPLRPWRLASASISCRFLASSPRVMISPLTLAAISSTTLTLSAAKPTARPATMSTTDLRNIADPLFYQTRGQTCLSQGAPLAPRGRAGLSPGLPTGYAPGFLRPQLQQLLRKKPQNVACRSELRSARLADHIHEPRRIHPGFRVELNIQHVMAAVHRLDADLLRQRLERGVHHQVVNRLRHWAISILQFLFGTVARRVIGGVGDLPVGAQPLVFVADVLRRNAYIQAQVEGRTDLRHQLLALPTAFQN